MSVICESGKFNSMKQLVPRRTTLLHYAALTTMIRCSASSAMAQPGLGKRHINITKRNNRETSESEGAQEIRKSFIVRSDAINNCGSYDTVPAGNIYIKGISRFLINQEKIYKQFTDDYGYKPYFFFFHLPLFIIRSFKKPECQFL